MSRKLFSFLLLIISSGCVSSGHLAPQPAPIFDPPAFFGGTTHGDAVLKIVLHHSKRVIVDGQGQIDADGSLTLVQTVRSGLEPAKIRSWRLHPTGPGRWTGTLSDAASPVTGQVNGNLLDIRFAMTGGLRAQQWLYLQPGGNTVRNVMVVRKFGVPVARLEEVITRRPPAAAPSP